MAFINQNAIREYCNELSNYYDDLENMYKGVRIVNNKPDNTRCYTMYDFYCYLENMWHITGSELEKISIEFSEYAKNMPYSKDIDYLYNECLYSFMETGDFSTIACVHLFDYINNGYSFYDNDTIYE